MKSAQFLKGFVGLLLVLATALPASAAITLYEKDSTTFSVDGSFNTFYVYSDSEKNTAAEAIVLDTDEDGVADSPIVGEDRQQSRVKMGFLPNWIGFNFGKQVGDLKLGGRASFWVSINDSDSQLTDSFIDVRQFYGTVDAGWGQVLFGKDFTLFNRSNIFLDEILLGYGNVSDTLGLVDGANVSFGNIGTGYTYPMPSAQITYRSPELAGLRLAIGLIDPSRTTDGEEKTPRLEGELTYNRTFGAGSITGWVGFLAQNSDSDTGDDVDSRGVSYGVKAKIAGLGLHASGFNAEGVGLLLGPGPDTTLGFSMLEDGDEVDSDGYLLQASYTFGPSRVVASYGKNDFDGSFAGLLNEWENETITGAYFYSVNDYLKLVAEYNVNEISSETAAFGDPEEKTKTIALGAILNF